MPGALCLGSEMVHLLVYMLGKTGFSRNQINAALVLLRDTACSIALVEKSHAGGALHMKMHQRGGDFKTV